MKTLKQNGMINISDVNFYVKEFAKNGYLKFSNFFAPEVFNALLIDSLDLLNRKSRRKDFVMEETNFTLRKISTVSGNVIHSESKFISEFYKNKDLVGFLEKISGKQLFLTPDMADRHTIHRLHKKGDEHGGHVDTYPYVFIICLEYPGEDGGGELEFVPNSKNIEDLKTKKTIKDSLQTGECYFMHSGANVHCVLPLKKDINRTVLVFTYADIDSKDIEISYSSDKLYN